MVFRALLSVLVGRPRGATLAPPAILKVKFMYKKDISGVYMYLYVSTLYMCGLQLT